MIQAVALFLVGMAALAIYSRFRRTFPKRPPTRLNAPVLCGTCGRLTSASKPCDCRKGHNKG